MKILLHICCAPCTVFPLDLLRDEGLRVHGYFNNPNIHPYREFRKRLDTVREFAGASGLPVEYDQDYGLRAYLRQVVFHEDERCERCYRMRLAATALQAKAIGADCFSTTLLYSRYQNHEQIRQVAEALAQQEGIPFYYRDFRGGWQEGIDRSKAMGLYRQSYCGCIYSEEERYDKRFRRGRTG